MYETEDLKYCYSKSNILINKFNIRDSVKLEEVERELSEFKMIILESAILENKLSELILFEMINEELLSSIHKFIFEDIYEWAGSYRIARISKGNTTFCYPENIKSELLKIFNQLQNEKYLIGLTREQFCERISYYIAEINVIHPFREGNGRVLRILSNLISIKSNYYINYSIINKKQYLNAMIRSVYDTSHLKILFTNSLVNHI